MQRDDGARISDDAVVQFRKAFRALWPRPEWTQIKIVAHLRKHGINVHQTTVSKWEGGRPPSIEVMNAIEAAFAKPRGWILHQAGFVDAVALAMTATDPQFASAAASGAEPGKRPKGTPFHPGGATSEDEAP